MHTIGVLHCSEYMHQPSWPHFESNVHKFLLWCCWSHFKYSISVGECSLYCSGIHLLYCACPPPPQARACTCTHMHTQTKRILAPGICVTTIPSKWFCLQNIPSAHPLLSWPCSVTLLNPYFLLWSPIRVRKFEIMRLICFRINYLNFMTSTFCNVILYTRLLSCGNASAFLGIHEDFLLFSLDYTWEFMYLRQNQVMSRRMCYSQF
jgi:hypothetical protein